MKTLLSVDADTVDKLNLLIRVAKEMGISVEKKDEVDSITLVSESALAEAWNSPEDARWDDVFVHLNK